MFDASNSEPFWGSLKFDAENIKFDQITLLIYTHYYLGKTKGKGSAETFIHTQLWEYPVLSIFVFTWYYSACLLHYFNSEVILAAH